MSHLASSWREASLNVRDIKGTPLLDPLGIIETPLPGETLRTGLVTIGGWATSGEVPAKGIILFANGIPIGTASTHIIRPDVAQHLDRPNLDRVGFSCEIHLSDSTAAMLASENTPMPIDKSKIPIKLQLASVSADGHSLAILANIDIELETGGSRLESLGGLEVPSEGSTVPLGFAEVSGWAVWGNDPAPLVVVEINGQKAGYGVAHIARPDVAASLDREIPELVGFKVEVDLVPLGFQEGDELDISASALGYLGNVPMLIDPAIGRFGTVHALVGPKVPRTNAMGAFDEPSLETIIQRGPLNIRGWALSPDNSPISRITIAVDRKNRGSARLGLPRFDLSQGHDHPHAVISGFELLIDLSDIPKTSDQVRITALVTSINGEESLLVDHVYAISDTLEPKQISPNPKLGIDERRAEIVKRRERSSALVHKWDRISTDEINLLAVTHDLGYGGGQLWLLELLSRSGAGRKFPCTVLAMKGGPLRRDLEKLGISVHVTGDVPIDDIDAYEGRLLELQLLLHDRRVNVVLANTFSAFAGADLAQRLELPCIWAIHESYPPSLYWAVAYPPNYVDDLVREQVERTLESVERVVFEAEATRQQYLEIVPDSHAIVMQYGIDNVAIDTYCKQVSKLDARRLTGLPVTKQVLLVMGTTEPRKSQTFLAQAFSEIAQAHPDAHLVFVGDTGTLYAKALKAFVKTFGLEERVTLAPVTNDIYAWYRAADFFVSASDIESLPRSILEAMSFGLPVVAASVFGIPELITHAETGFLFEQRNMKATVDALRRALNYDGLSLKNISHAAKDVVTKHHDSSGYAASMVRLMRDLID